MAGATINQPLMTAIAREMPAQPSEPRAWFVLFAATARQLRDEFVAEFGTAREWRPTIRALDRIIDHYQVA